MTPVHDEIKAARNAAGLSVNDLAEAVGVAPNTVYRWERGEWVPTLANLEAVATATGHRLTLHFDPVTE